jgi:ATP-binding cassette subfamily B protein
MSNRFEEKDFQNESSFKVFKDVAKLLKDYKKYISKAIMFNILVAICDTLFPILNRYGINKFINTDSTTGFTSFILVYVVMILIMSIAIYFFFYYSGKIEMEFAYGLREKLFTKIEKLPFSFFDTNSSGWLLSRLTSDINRLAEIAGWSLSDIFWAVSLIVITSITMLVINYKIALLIIIIIIPIGFISYFFQIRILKGYRNVRKENSKVTNLFAESINGVKTTKTLVLQKENEINFDSETEIMKKVSIKVGRLTAIFRPAINFISSLAIALTIWYGGILSIKEILDFGTLLLFIQYAQNFFVPIKDLAGIVAEIQLATASAERIIHIIDTPEAIYDSEEVIKKYGNLESPIIENYEKFVGTIEFKDVSFYYNKEEIILDKFNLKVEPKETVALVGETGGGKSTIVNLLCRFYEPISGDILIDNKNYKERSIGWLHYNLGYVLQSPHLFNGSIYDNIKYGKLNATKEEVINAAKLVNANLFIDKFENGYDTNVGEGGNNLSTGQKQLISLARAIIGDPSLIILDEATASIDTETEKQIQNAIDNIMKDKTSFIIAHRLSTIVNADKIVVIDQGKIIEIGNHEFLMKQKGYYYHLYTNQFSNEILSKI